MEGFEEAHKKAQKEVFWISIIIAVFIGGTGLAMFIAWALIK